MTDFYSRNDVNYNGDVYSIPFSYIKEKEIQVFLDDTLFEDWFFLNDSQIKLRNIPQEVTSNTIVSVRRITDIDKKVVTYTNNTLLNKENLNLSQDQLLYAVQEIYDNNIQNNIDIKAEVDEKVERVANAVDQLEKLNEAIDKASNAAEEATNQAEEACKQADVAEFCRQESERIHQQVREDSGIFYDEIKEEDIDVEIISGDYATKSDLEIGLDTKQDKGDYATRTELSDGLDTKQDKGNYALKSEIPSITNLATKDELPTQVSELENDSNYATQTQVLQAIASIPQFKLSIVEALPTTGEKMTLYLVPKEGTNNDVYDEYIWIEQTTSFEHLGTTAVDLTDYVKNTDYAGTTKAGIVLIGTNYGININTSTGQIFARNISLSDYSKLAELAFISKGTLENVLTQYSKTVLTTEADYEALETKDANTLYLIEE